VERGSLRHPHERVDTVRLRRCGGVWPLAAACSEVVLIDKFLVWVGRHDAHRSSVDASTSAPVKQVRVVTPFGKYEGTENTTWTNFQIGNPPASVWQVPDEKYCQQCGNGACQNDVKAAELFYGWRVAKQDE